MDDPESLGRASSDANTQYVTTRRRSKEVYTGLLQYIGVLVRLSTEWEKTAGWGNADKPL